MRAAVRTRYGPPEVVKIADVAVPEERIASGRFRPLVDRSYPLEQIVDAYRYVETGQKVGNVVITVVPQA